MDQVNEILSSFPGSSVWADGDGCLLSTWLRWPESRVLADAAFTLVLSKTEQFTSGERLKIVSIGGPRRPEPPQPAARVENESKAVSLWKSVSSSSPEVNTRASMSDPVRVDEGSEPAAECREFFAMPIIDPDDPELTRLPVCSTGVGTEPGRDNETPDLA